MAPRPEMASHLRNPNSSNPLNPYAPPFTSNAFSVLPPPMLHNELRTQGITTVISLGFPCPPGQHLFLPFQRCDDVFRVCSRPLWPSNEGIGGFYEPCVQERAGMERSTRRMDCREKKLEATTRKFVAFTSCSSSTVIGEPGEDIFCGKTTVMVKNIPNRFESRTLLNILDRHCREENTKTSSLVRSEYDFLYLPMDFRSEANKGYAFVNFTTPVAVSRFVEAFENHRWQVSRKVCQVTVAELQGKDDLENHFKKSIFRCRKDSYLPSVFSPPRDGFVRSPPTRVGRRM